MKNKTVSVTIYSICHFIVDFVSVIFILGKLPIICYTNNEFIMAVIIYNFFAFAFQVPIGYILDKFRIYKYIAVIGMSIIGICYFTRLQNGIILASLIGIGNALFHLEGGVNVYSKSDGKAFLNGLFVAPGALGIFLGTTFCNELIITYLPITLILISIILLSFVQRQETDKEIFTNKKIKFNKMIIIWIVFLIGISIIVRSIGGSAIVYTWKNKFIYALIYTCSIVFGKALGGLLADKFGLLKIALMTLFGSIIGLVIGHYYPILAYMGIFLFNMPMAITLIILENILSNKIACAVGLNTMFLFIGYLICFIDITINNNIILVTSIIIAMLSIYVAYKLYLKGGFNYEKN